MNITGIQKQIQRSSGFITVAWLLGLSLIFLTPTHSQTSQAFDLTAYKQFLSAHQGMSSEQLRSLYPAGTFASKAVTSFDNALYSDSIQIKYSLTSYEKSLIEKNGFVVSERLKNTSFGDAFLEIYNRDLPVFISTDCILHAIHMSYDAMLQDVEQIYLIQKLDSLLSVLHAQVPILANRYASIPQMKRCLEDVDLYLTVPRILLGDQITCLFPENASSVTALLNLVKAQQPADYPLFSSYPRTIDFSQFTIRGHYTQTAMLGRYFQAMMWLGRVEMYLVSPAHVVPAVADSNVQRQTIDAALLEEAAQAGEGFRLLENIDRIIRYFVGESDNVTLLNIRSLLVAVKIDSASELIDMNRFQEFQDTLKRESFAFQRIVSQILYSDPLDPNSVQPASSFLLLGQRFIVDSYITGNVVYDRIPGRVWRALPSSYDVLFALGNSAAAQLLEPQLAQYHYSSNLAALRYLVDGYDSGFWSSTMYNSWLNSIRALNPPLDRSSYPPFMKTASWWQEKMNTQLASWAQLRHDNLLYAKQSYTVAINSCSFPYSYVEPIPDFFHAVGQLAANASVAFDTLLPGKGFTYYWDNLKGVSDTLQTIAQKELSSTPLSESERAFLQQMLYTGPGICGTTPIYGWYFGLYYTGPIGFSKRDLVVADVHTCPTDADGVPVGWVFHVGTGPINLLVLTAQTADGHKTSFIGPVMSYYEHVSTNFQRLTDEEWKNCYQTSPSFRPDFVNLYLADSTGGQRPGVAPSLVTLVTTPQNNPVIPSTLMLGRNFPNPFNSSTVITFSIPTGLSDSYIELWIHNILGQRVKQLLNQRMPSGKYAARWDGTAENGVGVASGVYFYSLKVGNHVLTGKMSLLK